MTSRPTRRRRPSLPPRPMAARSTHLAAARCAGLVVLAVVAALLLALPATATTYVMVSDEHLVESSAAAVQARVLSVDNAPGARLPSTDYMVEVEKVLAGEVTGRNLVVRVPGGITPEGVGLKLFGMPEMQLGERVVLFLNPSLDEEAAGTWSVNHMMLGAFHEVLHQGERYLVRDLTGAVELGMPGQDPAARARFHGARRAGAFTRWVEERGRGREPAVDYFAEAGEGVDGSGGAASIDGQFRLFVWDNGLNIRWFEFDAGQRVSWRMQDGGQPGYSAADTAQAIRSAIAAWNGDGGSNINYNYAGTTPSTAGGGSGENDGINAVTFDDPRDNISGDFSCTPGGGGTLAVGGPFFSVNPQPGPGGQSYNVAVEGFIVTNRGIQCFLTDPAFIPQRMLEQLLAHEFGHTLGIDHPCEPDEGIQCNAVESDALMYPFIHPDDRGATLNPDDRAAARALYPGGSSGPRPAAPSDLAGVVLSSSSIQLTWTDNSADETAFVVQIRPPGSNFTDLVTLDADTTEYLVEDLEAQTVYGFRVRARNANGNSNYSNAIELETLSAIPAAPEALAAVPASGTSVNLTWRDASDNETDFVVEARNATSGAWLVVKEGVVGPPADDTVVTSVDGLVSGLPYSFRVRARNLQGVSEPSNVAAATPTEAIGGGLGSCVEEGGAICLLGDRFRVSVTWRNQHSPEQESGLGQGSRFPGSDRTGTFWFFNPDNVELIVKVLDGTVVNDYYWTFYGALTNVEYWVTVVDTTDGVSRTYYNPPFEECGQADTTSIPGQDVPIEDGVATAAPVRLASAPSTERLVAATGTCTADANTLCLLDDRFSVTVDWTNQNNGESGQGVAVPEPGSEKTGYFWFFNETNVELVVKALDATALDGNFWFFYGALSNVGYTITVTDTVDGVQKTYVNDPGNYCGQFDTAAFTPADPS